MRSPILPVLTCERESIAIMGQSDQRWIDAVKPHFSGNIVVGRDLMEL